MATGKRHIKNVDKGGWGVYRTRRWGERDYKSDRQKGIRKIIGKILRTRLKNETNSIIENEIE